ncbi:MAG: SDR family NAD(P)-dependent oxidoreductase [Oscillospiraceae bacterium]|jgi:NAD(P)-dependent dehydrogenase (short-subunit alcohol dehydrogenase family)|nr:SDR family NAD(P)-dependent oxidoreductase [Oscillospiraceae bacterium]
MKYVVMTGAYGGMGYAAAKALSGSGFTVFALDRTVRDAEPGVIPIETDVTDPESVERAFRAVKERTDEVYAIVHFAGIYRLDSLVEMSEERFTGIFDVNLFGAYRINKAFLPLLKEGSRIILTTSELAPLSPLPFTGIYAITKTALDRYAFSLRMELQLLGIGVCVIRPGAVKTELLSASTRELDRFCENTRVYSYNAVRFRKIVNDVETKNVAPQAVADTVLRALTARRTKYVYNVNRNPLLRLLNALPASWQTAVIRRVLKG